MSDVFSNVTDRFLTINGLNIHFREWGVPQLPPLIILHGFDAHSRSWDHVAAALADRYHIIVPDIRGNGESSWASEYSWQLFIEDTLGLMDALNLSQAILCGHSMGGRASYMLASRYPERVTKLIIVEALPDDRKVRNDDPPIEIYKTIEDAVAEAYKRQPFADKDTLRHEVEHGLKLIEDGKWGKRFDPALYTAAWQGQLNPGTELEWPALAKIECSTLLIYGIHSMGKMEKEVTRMRQTIPNCELIEIPDAAHDLPNENPQEFIRALRNYLTEEAVTKVITSIDQVTGEWLTAILAKSGALTHGEVASFEFGTGQGNWSTSANIFVKYTEAAIGSLPERLFLKMVNTDLDDEYFGDSEVTYYTRDYVDLDNAPLLRCYDAVYSKELNRYHLLLDDVSETHVTAAEKEPTLEYGLALAEGLAILHARWWGAHRLLEAGAPIHDESFIQQFIDIAAPGVEHIIKGFSSELKPHWPDAMRELYAKHPRTLIQRAKDLNGFTLIHGDAGAYNVLVPRQGHHPIYIIDRQPFNWSLTTWLGVYDLAYAIILDWDVETRRLYENLILKHYHNNLFENGVTDYSWEQLHNDYRLCVAMCVYIATEYCRGGVIERLIPVWLPMLQRALTACDDLECSTLWNEFLS